MAFRYAGTLLELRYISLGGEEELGRAVLLAEGTGLARPKSSDLDQFRYVTWAMLEVHVVMRRRLSPSLTILLPLAGCASKPLHRAELCTAPADLPLIGTTRDGREFLDLGVLIYNVEGLPWPARKNRGAKLDAIGDELARRRAAGTAPDIVLLQEVFTQRAANIGVRSGYRNIVPGPAAGERPRSSTSQIPATFNADRRFLKGERSGKLLGSGLQVLSDYPVKSYQRAPFSSNACAGFDCLANKGVMLARIWIPGLPTPVDVFTTHMNAQKASGVDLDRAHAAHRFQTDQSAAFLARARAPANPLIFGGDFNMRRAPTRLDHFTYRKPYHIVRHYCTVLVSDCDVRMSWDGDAPWLDTQDLQGFDDGAIVAVRPLRVEAKFDAPSKVGRLSDHDGYEVTYRLSWPRGANAEEEREVAAARANGRFACIPVLRD